MTDTNNKLNLVQLPKRYIKYKLFENNPSLDVYTEKNEQIVDKSSRNSYTKLSGKVLITEINKGIINLFIKVDDIEKYNVLLEKYLGYLDSKPMYYIGNPRGGKRKSKRNKKSIKKRKMSIKRRKFYIL